MESYTLIAASLAALITLPLQAAVYQWTDEQGRVHYSDRATHESAQQLQLPKIQASSQKQSISAERREMRRRMLEVYEQERREKREAAAQAKQQREERRRQCRTARANYENYNNASSIYERQDNGERIYFDKQQREEYMAGLKAKVERYCD
jgi:hypothetical protein